MSLSMLERVYAMEEQAQEEAERQIRESVRDLAILTCPDYVHRFLARVSGGYVTERNKKKTP